MSLKMACGVPSKRPILVSRHSIIINQFVQELTGIRPFPHSAQVSQDLLFQLIFCKRLDVCTVRKRPPTRVL